MYAEVVFSLPLKKAFTYSVPADFSEQIFVGVRVVAPFGKRYLTGFVTALSDITSVQGEIKPISDVLDEIPIFSGNDLKFYLWLSDYYLCSLGDALRLSVPVGTDVETKKRISSDCEEAKKLLSDEKNKNTIRCKLLKVFAEKSEVSLFQLQKLVKRKNILSPIRSLAKKGIVTLHEEVEQAKVKEKKILFVKLLLPVDEVYEIIPQIENKSPKQVSLLLKLLQVPEREMPLHELIKELKISQSTAASLVKKGIVSLYYKVVERKYSERYDEEHKVFELSENQNTAINEINNTLEEPLFKVFLLHGVTGSGKTQVYIEVIKNVLSKGKTAVLLVPEISLTPQMTARLINHFQTDVAVVHSRMSPGERFDSWQKILKGKAKVVIGARSALFAPLQNIGIIIVDEEHDHSYKQDETPRYQGRDCAVMRAKFCNVPVVLGSATPSVESMWNVRQNKYSLLSLPERIDNAKLPIITLVNIPDEKKLKRMENIFSKTLLEKIEDRLTKKEGVIILQNRRGFATQLYCVECGEIEVCNNCSVSMVYHINQNILQCHYCGFTKKIPPACSYCGSLHLKYFGTGTERVEDELSFYFPKAVIKRIDSDTMSKKGNLGEVLAKFKNGEIEILVGTQIVSKGMDFSRVTLVGVISAETSLWMPDFRADERTFQLLTQVSGRAGRSKIEGEVLIQTQNHRHFVLRKVLQNDYFGFYEKEELDRKKEGYPPFVRLCLVESKHTDEEIALGAIKDFFNEMKKFSKVLKISPPTTAIIARLKGEFRYQVLIKSGKDVDPGGSILRKAVEEAYSSFNRKTRYHKAKLFFDIDPQSIV